MDWKEYVESMFNYGHVQIDMTLHRNIWRPGITGREANEYLNNMPIL